MTRRSQIPKEVVNQVMFLSGHRCCLERGEPNPNDPLEIHHLDGNPNNNNQDNLMPLCKNCHHGRVHVSASISRGYSIDELKHIRNDWYSRIEEKRNEDARSSTNDLKAVEDEQKLSQGLQFCTYFDDSEINFGKNSHITFDLNNNIENKVKLLSYRFEIFYILMNRLIPHISFSKHYWDLIPSELGSHESKVFSFGEVDPCKCYFLSDEKGKWIARVFIEYTYNKKIVNVIYSDATIRII